MRRGHSRLDRQAIVEQQHALFGPMPEVTVPRRRNAEVGLHLLIDVDQARRHPHPRLHGKARSEEHTSELQSLMRISYAVFCLKKKHSSQTICTLTDSYVLIQH